MDAGGRVTQERLPRVGLIRRSAAHPFGATSRRPWMAGVRILQRQKPAYAPSSCASTPCWLVEPGVGPHPPTHLINTKAPTSGAFVFIGGEGGIRTHGTRERTTDFESVPFGHSGTSPITCSVHACVQLIYSGHPCPPPFGPRLRAFQFAPGELVESVPFGHSGTSPIRFYCLFYTVNLFLGTEVS